VDDDGRELVELLAPSVSVDGCDLLALDLYGATLP
jgi:hypothetical protein